MQCCNKRNSSGIDIMIINTNASDIHSDTTEIVPLNEQQREMAARHMSVALSIARQFSKSWKWLQDDLESAALLALVECARVYDPSYNVKFSTFAKHRINGALINFRKKFVQAHFRKYTSDPDAIRQWFSVKPSSNLSQSEVMDLEMKSGDESVREDGSPGFEIRDEIEALIRTLPIVHQAVMTEVYLNHRSLKQTSIQIGYSISRVFAIHREAIQILRENAGSMNPFHFENKGSLDVSMN